eukprot:223784-Prorocentrum_minimum.AAC.1
MPKVLDGHAPTITKGAEQTINQTRKKTRRAPQPVCVYRAIRARVTCVQFRPLSVCPVTGHRREALPPAAVSELVTFARPARPLAIDIGSGLSSFVLGMAEGPE